ncbi:MAG: diadenylate cyclase CdaA [Lachnospiraceae bacterium]
MLDTIFNEIEQIFDVIVRNFRFNDALEIIIISVLIYYIMSWIKKTKAWSLLKGVVVIGAFVVFVYAFNMRTLKEVVNVLFQAGLVAIVVIFQPELRRALETLGDSNLMALFSFGDHKNVEGNITMESIDELVNASFDLGKHKTGSLIVIEKNITLEEYVKTGIILDAVISAPLLIQIFEHNTPLHDGAVIIQKDRIVSATCYLPLSDNMGISKDLGTRHRAGLGISEVTDSLTIIASEETGHVSIAQNGVLDRNVSQDELRNRLIGFISQNPEENNGLLKKLRGMQKNNENQGDSE